MQPQSSPRLRAYNGFAAVAGGSRGPPSVILWPPSPRAATGSATVVKKFAAHATRVHWRKKPSSPTASVLS